MELGEVLTGARKLCLSAERYGRAAQARVRGQRGRGATAAQWHLALYKRYTAPHSDAAPHR